MKPILLVAAASAKDPPLIDLDSTLLLQLGLFLLATLVLSKLLFRPFLQVRTARERGIEGARDEARRMDEEARARLADYEGNLGAARRKANDERGRLRAETAQREREITEAARSKATTALDEARRGLAAQEQAARAELEPRAAELARSIANKVLGREVA